MMELDLARGLSSVHIHGQVEVREQGGDHSIASHHLPKASAVSSHPIGRPRVGYSCRHR